jgi:RAT1-interacting protein
MLTQHIHETWVTWQEIVVGFRTPNGKLVTVQPYKTLEIPRLVRGKQDAWDAQICLSWAETFLTWIRSNVEAGSDAPGSVWRVKFTPRVGVQLALLQEEGRREVEAGEDRVGFLPRWYWNEMQDRDVSSAYGSASGAEPEPSRSSASTASVRSTLPTGWQI